MHAEDGPSAPDGRARLRFDRAVLAGMVTTVGGKQVLFADEAQRLGLGAPEAARLQRALGLHARQVVAGDETTVDLCAASATKLLAGLGVAARQVQALILVTQTPDHAAPSSAIALQHRLGLPVTAMAFDMRLGCSGFVYGLSIAFSLVQSGLERVLLCCGDVASRLVDGHDHTIAPLMGDAGAAALITRGHSHSTFELYSDGSGQRALMVPNSGLRRVVEDAGKPALMAMDGAAVFNFTLQRVPGLINEALAFAECTADEIDYFVLHQPNKYILHNMQKRLGLSEARMPCATQSVYGNQNSASIPGTVNGFLSEAYQAKPMRSLFAGFGIGLSWGACVLQTDRIYAPPTTIGIGTEP